MIPFEQIFLIIIELFQSEKLEQYMITIGVDHLLSKGDFCEHIYLENIKKLYKSSVKFGYQQQYKSIIETYIVSSPEGLTNNSIITEGMLENTKIFIEKKLLSQF